MKEVSSQPHDKLPHDIMLTLMLLLIKEGFVWLLNSEEIAEDWNDGLSYNKKVCKQAKERVWALQR